MIRRPPRSTLPTHSFPTRRSSDLQFPSELGGILDIAARAGTDLVITEDDFFGDTATHGHGQVRIHLVPMVAVAIPLRQSHHHAQSAATWNDRRLVHGIGSR